MAQQPISSPDLPADFDHHIILFPTRSATDGPAEPAAHSTSLQATGPQGRVRTHAIRQVVVLEVSCRLSEVVAELDQAIQLALADGPRGVVCDLSNVLEGTDPDAVEVLATAGRHVRDWPGTPVAVACPDPRVREALRAHPLGDHLIVTPSLFSAVSEVLATPTLAVERKHIAAHPTAPRASREFVTRTLLDWRLGRVIPFASLVIGELVASSSINAGTDIDLSVVWNSEALRLTVRDHGPALPGQRPSLLYLHGRRLTVVAGLSRAFGVLPAADGGKVVWAVLDAPRSRPSDSPHLSALERQESLILNDAHGRAELPFGAASSPRPPENPFRLTSGGDDTSAR
jgi:hypothetical protein